MSLTIFHNHDVVQLMYETIEAVLLEADKLSPQRRKNLITAHLAIQTQMQLREMYAKHVTGSPAPEALIELISEVTEERVMHEPETGTVRIEQRLQGLQVYLPHFIPMDQLKSNFNAAERASQPEQEQA